MTMQIRKAERKQSRMRIAASGPSGSGKTMSMLLLAKGMVDNWNEIGLIDTENKRGDIYSDLGEYNIITLEAPFTPERFIEAIRACEQAGMKVIIIDSTSHEWEGPGGCLEINEKLAQTKFKGNSWAAWSETTPRHQKFIEAIIQSSAHVISTMRSKTDTIQTEDKKIKKVGLKDIQREGFEYEMTVSFNIDRDTHYAMVGKDNTQLFKNDPFMITIEHGKMLRIWNESGKEDPTIKIKEKKSQIWSLMKDLGLSPKNPEEANTLIKGATFLELSEPNYDVIIEKLKAVRDQRSIDVVNNKNQSTLPVTQGMPLLTEVLRFKEEIERTTDNPTLDLIRGQIENSQNITPFDKGQLKNCLAMQEAKFKKNLAQSELPATF